MPLLTKFVDIRSDHLQIVQAILHKHLPQNTKVWVFGSRAKQMAKKFSDLDLALESKTKIDNVILIDIKEALEHSDLPYRVDVVDVSNADETFRKIIENEKIAFPQITTKNKK